MNRKTAVLLIGILIGLGSIVPMIAANLRILPGSISDTTVDLFWDKAPDYKKIIRYELYCDNEYIGETQKNNYTVSNLLCGKEYKVCVKSIYSGKVIRKDSLSFTTKKKSVVLNICDKGAIGNDRFLNTKCIQNTINACPEGGTVFVPKGVYITGALFIKKSNITLLLEEGAVLKASHEIADFPIIDSRYEGRLQKVYAGVLTLGELNGERFREITIKGKGVIDGQGSVLADKQTAMKSRLERAHGLAILSCDNVCLKDFVIQNPCTWCIHPVFSKGVTTNGVTVLTNDMGLSNADGWDPDSSSDCYLINSVLNTYDDHVAIKSGSDKEGRSIGIPSENIYVSYCHFGVGGGVAVGSEMSGGVNNVVIENCVFESADRGFHIKSRPGRGGKISNILFRDIVAQRFGRWGISLDMWYYVKSYQREKYTKEEIPSFENISFENISIDEVTGDAIQLRGLCENSISSVHFSSVYIGKSNRLILLEDCKDIFFNKMNLESYRIQKQRAKNIHIEK